MSHTPVTEVDGASGDGSKNPFVKVWRFLKQVIDELRKVIVPTRSELLNYTLVVLVFVLIVIGIVTGLDWIFSRGADFIFGG
ncbi:MULTISPECIES: preprotein translocase subunit SecE [Nesterenkonia]|uniref:preprotein translocase subunit SecE n=1 Tax=Nesterenkonia TaxID=57494 RepID=UPI001AF00B6A|nr:MULTISPECIES: preprotein translocase subunit SecE [Nesterenkonia]